MGIKYLEFGMMLLRVENYIFATTTSGNIRSTSFPYLPMHIIRYGEFLAWWLGGSLAVIILVLLFRFLQKEP